MFAYRNSKAPIPAQVLCSEASDEWSDVRSVCQEQGEYAHVEPSLVHEIQITYRRGADSSGAPSGNPIDRPSRENTSPSWAVTRRDIGDGTDKIP